MCVCKSGYLDHGSHSHRSRKHKKSKKVKKRHTDRSVIAIHQLCCVYNLPLLTPLTMLSAAVMMQYSSVLPLLCHCLPVFDQNLWNGNGFYIIWGYVNLKMNLNWPASGLEACSLTENRYLCFVKCCMSCFLYSHLLTTRARPVKKTRSNRLETKIRHTHQRNRPQRPLLPMQKRPTLLMRQKKKIRKKIKGIKSALFLCSSLYWCHICKAVHKTDIRPR